MTNAQHIPTLDQFAAAFIRDFRETSLIGDEAAVPTGDEQVFFNGVVPLIDLLAPLLASAWTAGYEQALGNRTGETLALPNPYGEESKLPSPEAAAVITSYE